MPLFRKIIFYIFALIYLICCPLIILYALGFVFNPQARKVVKTGIISLNSIPSGAAVSINKTPLPNKTPTNIHNLPPEQYLVTLTHPQYRPWEKRVPVVAEQATTIDHILLIPESWALGGISPHSFEQLIPMEGNSFLLLQKGKALKDLFIYRFQEGMEQKLLKNVGISEADPERVVPIFSDDFIYAQGEILSYYTVKSSPFLLLEIDAKGKRKFLWVDPREKKTKVNEVTDLFPKVPQQVLWDANEDKNIFSFQDNYLNRLNVIEKAIYPKYSKNVQGFGVKGNAVYLFHKGPFFVRVDLEGKEQQLPLKDPDSLRSLLGMKNDIRISVLENDLFLFWGKRGELSTNRFPFIIVKNGVNGFSYNRASQQLLVWTDNKIGIADFTRQSIKGKKLKKLPTPDWFVSKGKNIRQAFWVYQGSHLLFLDQDQIFLIEIATYDHPILTEVGRVKRGTSVYYSDSSGKVFFLDAQTGMLSEITIIPPQSIIPLPKPLENETQDKDESL
jgi:hypothetical protein